MELYAFYLLGVVTSKGHLNLFLLLLNGSWRLKRHQVTGANARCPIVRQILSMSFILRLLALDVFGLMAECDRVSGCVVIPLLFGTANSTEAMLCLT